MVKTLGMEFFCYHRDRPGSMALRDELLEEHWSYMDRYAKEMIARGPTLADDRDTATGSVHILDLPDPATARAFAFDEPGYQAGVYRTCCCAAGATCWGAPCGTSPAAVPAATDTLCSASARGRPPTSTVPPGRDELIAYGPLLSDDGAAWLGTAALVRAPDPDTARTVLTTPDRYAGIEVHNWQFGGRQ